MTTHLTIALLIALIGSVIGHLLFGGMDLPLLSGIGAFGGGLATAQLFGRRGRLSAVHAGAGAMSATLIGAALAGFVLDGSRGAAIAALAVPLGLVSEPLAGCFWLSAMVGTHLFARYLREIRTTG